MSDPETKTPRTDEAERPGQLFSHGVYLSAVKTGALLDGTFDADGWVPAYFARTLERALAASEERVAQLEREKCRHGWRGSVPEEGARIVTPCPTCGGQLFVGSGGHLICASVPSDHHMGCPQPGVERAINELRQRAESAEALVAQLTKERDALHGLVEQLAHRFKGYLPWPDQLRDSVVRGHEMFIEDTIKKADAARGAP